MITNDIVSFEQLGPGYLVTCFFVIAHFIFNISPGIKTYFIKGRKNRISLTKEPGSSAVKPESVTVNVDDQSVPNATESDNLMNESHTIEKEVLHYHTDSECWDIKTHFVILELQTDLLY